MDGGVEFRGIEMLKYLVSDISARSTVMGVWTRKGPLWSFKALAHPATGCTIEKFLQVYLSSKPAHA